LWEEVIVTPVITPFLEQGATSLPVTLTGGPAEHFTLRTLYVAFPMPILDVKNGSNANTPSPDKQKEVQRDVLTLRHGAQSEMFRKPAPPQSNEELLPQEASIGRCLSDAP